MSEADHFATALTSAPATEPVTLPAAKAQCRVGGNDEDTLFTDWIIAAREMVETDAKMQLVTATRTLYLDRFPRGGCLLVPHPPLQSVTSIVYLDTQGASTTWDSAEYRVDSVSRPGRITLGYGYVWPATYSVANAITITYVCGYGAASAVPQRAKQAILMLVGHWYQNREATGEDTRPIPMGYSDLINSISWGRRF